MCRGTTNMEDVYLISKEDIPVNFPNNLKWIEHHGGIPVDLCIGKEVEFLIKSGVVTYGCCCGHGEYQSTALVSIESKDLLKGLGYDVSPYSEMHTAQGIVGVNLRTGTQIIQ